MSSIFTDTKGYKIWDDFGHDGFVHFLGRWDAQAPLRYFGGSLDLMGSVLKVEMD